MSSQPPSNPNPTAPLLDRVETHLRAVGFENFGFTELRRPLSLELYETWLAEGRHGEMQYLVRHLPDKRDPERVLPQARSAIVITQNYVPHPEPKNDWPLSAGSRVAAYARGRDYHGFFSQRLAQLQSRLEAEFPGESFRYFTDSGPVLERDLAARAGLGWVGKNTCLIDRKRGSMFFIGELYTTLRLPSARIVGESDSSSKTLEMHDFCGTCTRCIDACPTQAIIEPKKLDARLCISYLTIESRKIPPTHLREKMGDWLFGCDICQTVCPWNIKFHGKETLSKGTPDQFESTEKNKSYLREMLVADLRYLLTSSHRQLERDFSGTPLSRAGGFGLKRNALVVAANRRLTELKPEISALIAHDKLGELATWAIQQLA